MQLIVHKQYKTRNSTSCQHKEMVWANSGKGALELFCFCFGGCKGERRPEEQIATIKTEETAHMGVLQDHGQGEKSRFHRCCVASQKELRDYQGGKLKQNEILSLTMHTPC